MIRFKNWQFIKTVQLLEEWYEHQKTKADLNLVAASFNVCFFV